jgi:hypothetical protein
MGPDMGPDIGRLHAKDHALRFMDYGLGGGGHGLITKLWHRQNLSFPAYVLLNPQLSRGLRCEIGMSEF